MDLITVCIVAYKRPFYLDQLLHSLVKQTTSALFLYDVVVVDNDPAMSGKKVIDSFTDKSKLDVRYYYNSINNISLARNIAMEHSTGDYIAFIDDDEFPSSNWLLKMYRCCTSNGADIVAGPVAPVFEYSVSNIMRRSDFFSIHIPEKYAHPDEFVTMIGAGNCLIRKKFILENNLVFSEKFGLTGGEDTDFFVRSFRLGGKLQFCRMALVHHRIPKDRMIFVKILSRVVSEGRTVARIYFTTNTWIVSFLKILWLILVFCVSLFFLPFFCVMLILYPKVFFWFFRKFFHIVGFGIEFYSVIYNFVIKFLKKFCNI